MATKSPNEFTARMFEAINGMLLEMLAAVARKDYDDRRRRQAQGQAKAKAKVAIRGVQRTRGAIRDRRHARCRPDVGRDPERHRLQPRYDREDCQARPPRRLIRRIHFWRLNQCFSSGTERSKYGAVQRVPRLRRHRRRRSYRLRIARHGVRSRRAVASFGT
jgi:hypothetical protein